MLIRFVRPLAWLVLWVFFRRIEVRGGERIPTGCPLILVANHPNVMIDTLILGVCTPGQTPRFLGKATLFKRPFYAWFLSRLGVIPVARSQDPPEARAFRNRDMLRTVCQTLRAGHSLVVFPEGASHPEPRLREIKPGTARIALRTELDAGRPTGLLIVPVGLTYTEPGAFRSEVHVQFGQPIAVADFAAAYPEDRDGTEDRLTGRIREGMLSLTLHIERSDLEAGIRELLAVYTPKVESEIGDFAGVDRFVRAEQEIVRAAQHFAKTDPELVRTFLRRLRAHHRKLRVLGVGAEELAAESRAAKTGRLLLALVLAPVAAYGFLHNALPYYLPRLLARPYRNQAETVGTVKMSAGIILFPACYGAQTWLAWTWVGPAALVYGLTLPLSGLLTLMYQERLLRPSPPWGGAFQTPMRRRHLRRVSAEREAILRDLDALKERYLASLV